VSESKHIGVVCKTVPMVGRDACTEGSGHAEPVAFASRSAWACVVKSSSTSATRPTEQVVRCAAVRRDPRRVVARKAASQSARKAVRSAPVPPWPVHVPARKAIKRSARRP